MRSLMAAALAVCIFATPAHASTQQQREHFIASFVARHTERPKEPWAHTKRLRISDGWANKPVLTREAAVHFVVKHGYVHYPKPSVPIATGGVTYSGSAFVQAAPTSYSADWDAIAMCEGGGDWSMVKPDSDPYYFVLQFSPGTWLAYGGTQAELDAGVAPSRARLIQVAEAVLAGQGPGAWPNCFRYQ